MNCQVKLDSLKYLNLSECSTSSKSTKNNILSIERNTGQTEYTDKVPYKLIEKYKNLDSP